MEYFRSVLVFSLIMVLIACSEDNKEVTAESDISGEKIDLAPPVLVLSEPANNEENVRLDVEFLFSFDEIVNLSTQDGIQARVYAEGAGEYLENNIQILGSVIKIIPSSNLEYDTKYIIELVGSISDIAGNTSENDISININTEPKPVVSIDMPSDNDVVKSTIVISGTSSDEVKQVQVNVGEFGYIEAEGTAEWELLFDTRLVPDGATKIIVKATSEYGDVFLSEKIVRVQNIDPLVGAWSCVESYDSGQVNQPETQYFFESGSMAGDIFSCWVSGWERQRDLIIIHRSNCSDLTFVPKFNSDHSTLNFRISDWSVACTRL